MEEEFFLDNNRYATSLNELNYYPSQAGVELEILGANEDCFEAIGMHEKTYTPIGIDCNGFQDDTY